MTTSNPLALAHLRRALLAALALLALGIGVVPGQAVASDAPGAPEANTITTVLYPGWNMVGWVGPSTPASELFDTIPALRQVSAWDAEAQAYEHAVRRRYDDLATVTPGIGLWLRLDGRFAVHWTRTISDGAVPLSLQVGRNLVGWTGKDGTTVEQSLAPFAGTLVRAWAWDAANQAFLHYSQTPAGARELDVLRHGDALWIEVSEPVDWWRPGTPESPYHFLGDISPEIQESTLAGYRRALRFFGDRFAISERGATTYIVGGDQAGRQEYLELFGREYHGGCGFPARTTAGESVQVRALGCAYPLKTLGVHLRFVYGMRYPQSANRYAITGRVEDTPSPDWMRRGQQMYLRALHRSEEGWEDYQTARSAHIANAARTQLPLSSFESDAWKFAPTSVPYSLGFLAVEWLTPRAGDFALTEYYRLYWSAMGWGRAFEAAFGMTVDDFYAEFEAVRATLVPPLPHMDDDAEAPVLVVLDDLPPEHEAPIRTEFEQYGSFLDGRFDAPTRDLTVYVAPDRASAIEAVPWWNGVIPWEGVGACVQSLYEVTVIVLESCEDPAEGRYIESVVVRGRLPWWLGIGTESYATAAYEASDGRLDLAEHRAAQVAIAVGTSQSLQRLSRPGRATDDRSATALGFLAAEWLAQHAGEPALIAYYQQHHPIPESFAGYYSAGYSYPAAFEAAFGLTLEEFYKQFEAYRATLPAE